MVMPSSIVEYPHNLLINDEVLVHCIVAGLPPVGTHHDGYPRDMKANIIDLLTDIDSGDSIITMSQTIIPIDRVSTGNMIQDAVINNDMKSIWDKNESEVDHPDLILKYSAMDLEANFKTHHEANQNMFDSMFIFLIYARSEKELRIAKGKVSQKLDANLIMHESPTKEHLKAFLLALGMPMSNKETEAYKIQIFSRVAAVLSTLRTQNDDMSTWGLYYGNLVKTNKNLLIDFNKLPAKHQLIFGSTGSGKTVAMITWCMRAHDLLNYRIVYMTDKADTQTDFLNSVKSYGDDGQIIDIGPGMENINPMQIFYEKDRMSDSIFAHEQVYDRHKGTLKAMFNAWKKDDLTTRQEAKLDMHVDDCYEKFGIFRSLPDTWTGKWPLMSNLITEFARDADNDVSSQALLDMAYPLGPKGELNYLNKSTTVNFDKSFQVIDLSKVPGSFKKAQNVLVAGIIAMQFNGDRSRTTIIAVDEAGSLMRDPNATAFLLSINTKGRSDDVGLWLGSQQPQDIIKAGVWEQMGNNMFVVCLFGRKSTKKGISALAQHFSLDEDAQLKLLSCDIGQCVIMVEEKVYHTTVKLSPYESNILLGSKIEKQTTASVSKIDPAVYKIAMDHGVFFKDLINGDSSQFLEGKGFEQRRNQDAIGRGQMYYLINSALIKTVEIGDKTVERIGVQSLDHYVTVVRIASYLASLKVKVLLYHHRDSDLVLEINGKTIALEYERPGSHCGSDIRNKNIAWLKKYDTLYFITTSSNYDEVVKNIDEKFVVKRGIQLKELLDSFITENSDST